MAQFVKIMKQDGTYFSVNTDYVGKIEQHPTDPELCTIAVDDNDGKTYVVRGNLDQVTTRLQSWFSANNPNAGVPNLQGGGPGAGLASRTTSP